MDKKGMQLSTILQIIIAAAIVLFAMYIGKAYGSQEIYLKSAESKEIALLIDAIYSAPGNVETLYNPATSGDSFEFSADKVHIFESLQEKGLISYGFVGIENMPLKGYFGKPNYIVFSKSGDSIMAYSDEEKDKIQSPYRVSCEPFKTDLDLNQKTVVYRHVDKKEDILTDDEKLKTADVVIFSYTGENKNNEINNIRAFVPSGSQIIRTSMYAACHIVNGIIDKNVLKPTGASIVPIEEISQLKEGQIMIYVEIGNKNYKEKQEITREKAESAIQEAFEGIS